MEVKMHLNNPHNYADCTMPSQGNNNDTYSYSLLQSPKQQEKGLPWKKTVQ